MAFDVLPYVIGKGYTNQVALGIGNMRVEGTTVYFTIAETGEEIGITLPTPADGVSVVDVNLNDNHELTFFMSDGTEIVAGQIEAIKGSKGDKGDKGDDGENGVDGKDGFSPTVSVTEIDGGHEVNITDKNGTKSFDVLNGEKGDKGDKGDAGANGTNGLKGEDGYTPVKGTDYWTDDDKTEIINEVSSKTYLQSEIDIKFNSVNDDISANTEAINANKTDILSVATEYEKNPLYGKKVSFLGDSICAGSEAEGRYLGGYGRIIAERNGMVYENVARGGATITAKTYTSEGVAKPWLCRMVENMSADSDYVIVEGGINDAWHWQSHGLEIGSISNGYTAELDDTTYYGAFESMLKQLITRFKGKKIGYIAVPKMMKYYDSERNVPNFYHIAMECCAKWGVPVCDLNTIIPPTEFLNTLGNEHSIDGVHPTYEGYLQYYCDPIEAWMKTLTTSNTATTAQKIVEAYMQGVNEAIEALQTGKLSNVGVSFRRAKLPLADGTTIEIDVLTAVDGTVIIPYTNRVPLSIDTDGSIFNGTGYMDGYRLSSSGTTKGLTDSAVTGYIPAADGDIIRIYGCEWATSNHAMNYICAYDSDFVFIGSAATIQNSDNLTKNGTNFISSYTKDAELNAAITLTGATIAYIRVSSQGEYTDSVCKGKDMIVTVNEEI